MVGAVLFLALPGCGDDGGPTSGEVDAPYLRVARGARELTFRIERAIEHPPDGSRQLAREFRSFAGNVDYTATFLQTAPALGPAGVKAFVFRHSLLIYESTLRALVKRAPWRPHADPLLRGVREAGAEVRASSAAWERALRAVVAD